MAKRNSFVDRLAREREADIAANRRLARTYMLDMVTIALGRMGFREARFKKFDETLAAACEDYRKPRFPAEWRKDGNHYYAPNGCVVTFWGAGLAENFLVERWISKFNHPSKTVPAGLYAREKVMEFVASFN